VAEQAEAEIQQAHQVQVAVQVVLRLRQHLLYLLTLITLSQWAQAAQATQTQLVVMAQIQFSLQLHQPAAAAVQQQHLLERHLRV
jgi:hypothetical protein